MLGLPDETVLRIMQAPVSHTWLAQVIREQGPDEAECAVDAWLRETAATLFPRAELASRIARETLPLLLERKAVAWWTERHPEYSRALPEVNTPEEAAALGSMDVMCASQDDMAAATTLLREADRGRLRPASR